MGPIIPHPLYGRSDIYSCYGVKIKALTDAKGKVVHLIKGHSV